MSEASKLIADSLTGGYFKIVTICGKSHVIHPPTIEVICRMVSKIDTLNIKPEINTIQAIGLIAKESNKIINAISVVIIGDSYLWKLKSYLLAKRLRKATPKELRDTFSTIVELIQGKDFFACATSAQEVAKAMGEQK